MVNKVKPIKASEIDTKRKEAIPDAVFEVFNELITKSYSGGSATVYQKGVVEMLIAKGLNRKEIFDNHWLDVEGIYRKAGWKVEYDKPAFNETYEARFIFSLRPRSNDD